jgi:hypothetical protein
VELVEEGKHDGRVLSENSFFIPWYHAFAFCIPHSSVKRSSK